MMMMEVAVAVRAQMSHGNFRLLTISPKFHITISSGHEASSTWKKWQARALRRKIRAAKADLTSARKCKLLPAIKVKYHSYVIFFSANSQVYFTIRILRKKYSRCKLYLVYLASESPRHSQALLFHMVTKFGFPLASMQY